MKKIPQDSEIGFYPIPFYFDFSIIDVTNPISQIPRGYDYNNKFQRSVLKNEQISFFMYQAVKFGRKIDFRMS